jgi:hypothetical protein
LWGNLRDRSIFRSLADALLIRARPAASSMQDGSPVAADFAAEGLSAGELIALDAWK